MFVVVALKHSLAKLKVSSLNNEFQTFMQGNVPKKQQLEADKSKNQLKNSLNKLSATQETMLTRAKEMSKFVEQLSQHKVIMENLLKDQELRQAALASLKQQLTSTQQKVEKANTQKTELEKELIKEKQQANQVISEKDREIQKLITEKERKIQELITEKDLKIKELISKIDETQQKVQLQQSKLRDTRKLVSQKEKTINAKQTDNQELNQTIESLKSALGNKDREIKKYKGRSYHKAVRRALAERMSSRFKELGIDVDLDKATGKIFLRSNAKYLFKNDSFALEQDVKEKLKQVIPIYSEELLGDPSIRPLISEINIVGHASPRFSGEPVDPTIASEGAYKFNLLLSVHRATAVANYIFSHRFGSFEFKQEFRSLTQVSGMSFSNSIKNVDDNSPPKTEQQIPGPVANDDLNKKTNSLVDYSLSPTNWNPECGSYDCKKSRRVEIGFRLREDISDSINFLAR